MTAWNPDLTAIPTDRPVLLKVEGVPIGHPFAGALVAIGQDGRGTRRGLWCESAFYPFEPEPGDRWTVSMGDTFTAWCEIPPFEVAESAGRKRKPRDLKRWPPGTTQAQADARIDAVCGCAGKYDCDCVSVFNRARGAAWSEHNTK